MSDYEETSRIEELLKAILGEEANLEPPQSRVETLLWAILESGGGSSRVGWKGLCRKGMTLNEGG